MNPSKKTMLFELNAARFSKDNLSIQRVLLTNEYTRLDMTYIADDYYHRGGWIRISPTTFLLNHNDKKRYSLIHAENIPIAPDHHHFESSKDWRFFSIYFKPMPLANCSFDLIEEEHPEDTDFNIYSVRLDLDGGVEVVWED